MTFLFKQGDKGPEVTELQKLLVERGYSVGINGDFGTETYRAARAFQSQNLDQHGQPLVVDGKVGPLTWWSLTHPKPIIITPSAIDYATLPPSEGGRERLGAGCIGRRH